MNPLRRALSPEKAVAPVAATGETGFPQVSAPSARYRYGVNRGSAPVAATYESGSALPVAATATASCYRSATASRTKPVAAEPARDLRAHVAATAATAFARDTPTHR
ncbi:hypothetical protein GCM10027075_53980 [Streptomyces heilongjiangensis]